jgi:hypothetical protein
MDDLGLESSGSDRMGYCEYLESSPELPGLPSGVRGGQLPVSEVRKPPGASDSSGEFVQGSISGSGGDIAGEAGGAPVAVMSLSAVCGDDHCPDVLAGWSTGG